MYTSTTKYCSGADHDCDEHDSFFHMIDKHN